MVMRVYVRHCKTSNVQGKERPEGFNRREIFEKLLANTKSQITIILDSKEKHWIEDFEVRIIEHDSGSEGKSFLELLDIIKNSDFNDDDIVVLLEDDYLVHKNWEEMIIEGLKFANYVTLYDHPDKYIYNPMSSLKQGKYWWRTTPSTTNSYATTYKTLLDDMDIHQEYSKFPITHDHEKFLHLWSIGRTLMSSIPAGWSHEEKGMQCNLNWDL